LFDWQHAQKEANNDSDLFKTSVEKDNRTVLTKRVAVRCTAVGGAESVTENVLESTLADDEEVHPLQSRQTL
jgi:hypothetical protein